MQSHESDRLPLVLLGTVAGSRSVARAILKDTRTQTPFMRRLGDQVGDARIEEIRSDAVVLAYAGQMRTLRLSRQAGQAATVPLATATPAEPNRILRVESVDYRPNRTQTRLAAVDGLLAKASILPYTLNGRCEGLLLSGLDSIPLAKTAGLEEGDVLRVMNGQDITSKQKAFQIFRKVKTGDTLDIELLRNGRVKQLSFDLNQP